jgi:hypothetical protein
MVSSLNKNSIICFLDITTLSKKTNLIILKGFAIKERSRKLSIKGEIIIFSFANVRIKTCIFYVDRKKNAID